MSSTKQSSQLKQMSGHGRYCKEITKETSVNALQLKLEIIKQLYGEFQLNQSQLEEDSETKELENQFAIRAQFDDLYFYCHVKIQDLIKGIKEEEATKQGRTGGNNEGAPKQQEVKLPKVELIPFSGEYEDWTTFHDLFSSLIHTNKSIANVTKLHYLKANVLGPAKTLLRNITVADANYEVAWDKLKDRFDHKRFIVDSLLKKFFGQPKITNENHADIKSLIDTSSEIVQSLQLQGVQIGTWDPIIVFVIVSKLDSETHKQWELLQKKDVLPRFSELEDFLESRWQSLEMINGKTSNSQVNYSNNNSHNAKPKSSSNYETQSQRNDNKCFSCDEIGHKLYSCLKYNNLSIVERKNLLKSKRLCFNCLVNGHSLVDCQSASRCKSCKGKHHTSIHTDTSANNTANAISSQQNQVERKSTALSTAVNVNKKILLATAIIYVYTVNGEKIPAKALVDQGSENTIVSSALAKKLNLNRKPDGTQIVGIGGVEVQSEATAINLKFSSHTDSSFVMEVTSSTMDKISSDLPIIPVHREDWPHLKGIQFADPHFDRPSPIEVLLGAEVYEQIIQDGIIPKKDFSPTAQNSRLGWLLFGAVKMSEKYGNLRKATCLASTSSSNTEINQTLKAFWELEEIPEVRKLTIKEQSAEDIFLKNVHQNEEGRYVVALPFDPDLKSMEIGESKKAALHSLFRMEARFRNNNQLKLRYKDYIQALIESNHIELVPANRLNIADEDKFYLPHHAVLKEESLTTKLRVVFDASRKSSTGVSLNDKLLVGPRTQEDLFNILIRWRKHLYTFLADIEKMYRQVKIVDEHRDFQRLLWRFEENSPIMEYRITTVIDGTASASFLATRSLNKLAEDQSLNFPEAAKIVQEDFYVDNLASGTYSIEKAKQLQSDLTQIMAAGKLRLRQWYSNNEEILENVPMEDRHDTTTLVELVQNTVKTLGVYWNQKGDTFEFKVTPMSSKNHLTKRELLSDISKLFDPIGWLAPSTIKAKIFMQSLWVIKKLNWDDRVPENKMQEWRKYRSQLHLLENIKIPRWIGSNDIVQFQLHGFGDASNSAYSSVVFSRVVQSDGKIIVKNLSSKTKVAPIKTISTPKLELCGSVLVSRLITKVKESLKLTDVETFTYTDNQTVLAWIKAHPHHYNVFVANRVTEVQLLTDAKKWFFVPTDENPADCASRGIFPSELRHHNLWWNGPDWLSKPREYWPSYENNYETELEKRKITSCTHLTVHLKEEEYLVSVLKKHSSLSKLLWNTAYVTKFCSSKSKARKKIELPNAQDLKWSLIKWTSYVQNMAFREEIARIKVGDELLARSKLRKLRPFIDPNGLLRVGGRISKSNLAFNAKHPIIMPKHHYFTDLVIKQAHKYTLHGGPTLMSTFLSNYWIFGRSSQIKKIIGSCVICFPHRSKPSVQLMADLPINRVTQHRAFLHSGVDFAGPFITKTFTGRTRGRHANPTQKSYVAIFVCLATKALHIDLVSDMSADSFIACFKRFVSKRGKCSDLYSDNGKNFVSASKKLRQEFVKLMKDPELQSYLAHDGTTHHRNPPLSPAFGGLWEAGVKSIKYHLKRLIGRNTFTYEEMTTLLYQIEACLNSRPLCPVSDDVNDVSYLTPGHFLIGEAPITVPEASLLDENINRLSRWNLVQRIYQEFWKVWYGEYLSRLQQRPKWMKAQENIKPGQLVLLRDVKTIPAKWPVARILEVYPGDDKSVRVVKLEKHAASIKPPIPKEFSKYVEKLKTHKSILKRSIANISVLPIEDNQF